MFYCFILTWNHGFTVVLCEHVHKVAACLPRKCLFSCHHQAKMYKMCKLNRITFLFSCFYMFDNRLYRVNKHPTGCQTGCQTELTTGLTIVLNEQPLFVQPVVKPGCTTGLTTGCIV